MGKKHPFRLVTRAADGGLRVRDYATSKPLLETHTQMGIDDLSVDLSLRGLPVFRDLIGPIPDGVHVARYESPDIFEALTREWSIAPTSRRRHASRREPAAALCQLA
jgi:hypothetical protein